MGYTTDFYGSFQLDKPLTYSHMNYLLMFAETRRMKRDAVKTALRPDPLRDAVLLPVGIEGEFFVGESSRQDYGSDVLDHNEPASTQPGLWCQWIPNEDGTEITWDGGEKFYDYVEWLRYIVDKFLEPWGYKLTGECEWQGEDRDDRGRIVVENNHIRTQSATVIWED